MQFLIDTATDKPSELYKIGRFLVDTFELTEVEPPREAHGDDVMRVMAGMEVSGAGIIPNSVIAGFGPDDVEVDIDETALVAEVTLTAPPPPPPVPDGRDSAFRGFSDATPPTFAPAAPPAAVVVPPAQPAAPGEVIQYDAKGYPWDARIHATNRAQTIGKQWKYKRGVDPNLVVAVEAQNKPAATPVMSGAEAQAANFGRALRADTLPSAPASTESPVSVLPAAPPPPPPVASSPPTMGSMVATVAATSVPAGTVIDFRGLMQKIQQQTAAGKLTTAQVNDALNSVGLKPEEMAQLINNAPLIASVNGAIDKCLTP